MKQPHLSLIHLTNAQAAAKQNKKSNTNLSSEKQVNNDVPSARTRPIVIHAFRALPQHIFNVVFCQHSIISVVIRLVLST